MSKPDIEAIEARQHAIAEQPHLHTGGVNTAIKKDIPALIARIRELEAALEMVEWINIGYGSDVYVCPWCEGDQPHRSAAIIDGTHPVVGGHKPDCPRQAALKKAGAEC